MADSCIEVEVERGRARVTLNRPEKRNALSSQSLEELHDALWDADADRAVHSVIVRGAGKCFSAGYDLAEAPRARESRRTTAEARDPRRSHEARDPRRSQVPRSFDDDAWQMERAQRLRMALFDMHKPVIAQVHGHCLAGGTDVALLCDMIIAADDASFGFPPARDLGALPNNLWLYNVGPQWAKRLTLTGDTVTGKEAAQIGLVLKSVPAKLLEAEVEGLADRLALIDPDLLAANKRIINLGLELMGARTLQRLAVENDARGHLAESARGFVRKVAEKGLKNALTERDAKFGDGRARVNGPELRDELGRLKDGE